MVYIQDLYDTNYTKEEIQKILDTIKKCVKTNRFTISVNLKRQENINFITEYNIKVNKQIEILMGINVEDFCYSLQNIHTGYEYETLYVFVPRVQLYNVLGEKENVDIYIKFNIIEMPNKYHTIVISFHKLNKPIKYLFKK